MRYILLVSFLMVGCSNTTAPDAGVASCVTQDASVSRCETACPYIEQTLGCTLETEDGTEVRCEDVCPHISDVKQQCFLVATACGFAQDCFRDSVCY